MACPSSWAITLRATLGSDIGRPSVLRIITTAACPSANRLAFDMNSRSDKTTWILPLPAPPPIETGPSRNPLPIPANVWIQYATHAGAAGNRVDDHGRPDGPGNACEILGVSRRRRRQREGRQQEEIPLAHGRPFSIELTLLRGIEPRVACLERKAMPRSRQIRWMSWLARRKLLSRIAIATAAPPPEPSAS